MRRSLLLGLVTSTLAGLAVSQDTHNATLLGEEAVEGFARVDGLLFGGMSGIDYDPQSKYWYTVSDDTGSSSPVRFFVLQIQVESAGGMTINSNEVQRLNHPDGTIYEPGLHSPSSVRIIPPDPIGDEPYLIWSSEGVLNDGHKAGVFEMCTGASFMDGFTLAEHNEHIADEQGPRPDRAFESIALMPNMEMIAGYEESLQQDGPPAVAGSGTTFVRLLRMDYFKANEIDEMAYPLEEPPADMEAGARRSLVDMVAIDQHTLLAVENIEVPATGRIRSVRTELYLVDLEGATDIMEYESLRGLNAGSDFQPVSKTLLADNESLGGLRDVAFRGVTFGPMLDDGRASIIMISDNDCDQYRPTYFAFIGVEGLQPMRPFVKEGGRAYEARPISGEQGTPTRLQIVNEQVANKAAAQDRAAASQAIEAGSLDSDGDD